MNLALFDFDGTVTKEDTYTKFIFFVTPKLRFFIGYILVFPFIFLYKLGWLRASRFRPILSKVVFWNRSISDISNLANEFALSYLPTVLRNDVLEKIEWHKTQGDRIVLVSASLHPYLEIWTKSRNIELICSELESISGRYTGKYANGDCSEEKKLIAIKEKVDLTKFETIYAYGDTEEDFHMLSIADVQFYQGQIVDPNTKFRIAELTNLD